MLLSDLIHLLILLFAVTKSIQRPGHNVLTDINAILYKFLVDSKGEVVARFEPTVSMNFVSTVVSSKLY